MKRLRRLRRSARTATRAPKASAVPTALSPKLADVPLGFLIDWEGGSGRTTPISAKSLMSTQNYASYMAGRRRQLGHSDEDYAAAYLASAYSFRTVNAVANDVAGIPWAVHNKETGKVVADHALTLAIHSAKRQYKQDLIALWQKALRIFGESYIEPTQNILKFYTGTHWLNPLAVEPIIYNGELIRFDYMPYYGSSGSFDVDELVYDKIDSIFDDLRGQSLLGVVLTEINIDRDIQRYTLSWFLNDARPGGILTGRQGSNIDQNQLERVLEIIKEQTEGVGNKHRPVAIGAALEWQQVQQGPDTAHLAIEESVRRRICMALDIPISVAGAWDDARYQSAPEQRRAYYEGTIMREWTRLAGVINDELMPFFDDSGEHELRPDFTEIKALIEDVKQKTDMLNSRLEVGGITLNNYLRQLGDAPVAGGDVFLFKSGTVVIPEKELHRANEILQGAVTPATQITFGEAQGGAVAALPAPVTDTKQQMPPALPAPAAPVEGTKSACIALSLANNADLIALQRRVKEQVGDLSVEWNAPDTFHVTLIYVPTLTEAQLQTLKGALASVELTDLALRIGSLKNFDNLLNSTLHFRIRSNADLYELQETLYQLCDAQGLPMSAYSLPDSYTPHVTMGYASQNPPAITFNTNLTVVPTELIMWEGDDVVYRRRMGAPLIPPITLTKAVQEPKSIEAVAIDELKAWRKKVGNNKPGKAFKNYLIRDEIADGIRLSLADVEPDDHDAIKAVFERAQELISFKAIQATRIDFEDRFNDVLDEARAGNLTRRRWASITRSLIDQYCNKAFRDGLVAGGVDDEPDESEQDQIASFIREQSEYVTGLGAVLFRDEETISDALAEQKAEMWWRKSVQPMYTAGLASANGNQMMEFAGNDGDESCNTCTHLKGQRHRLKDWRRKRLVPGEDTDNFDCGGFRCEHGLVAVAGKARGNW